ncbi:MAG TPA: hypothetical protein VL995_21075 [Cellvibrio sp.]|nr:hypothetical protein [Cellvibrio sp.]
MSNAALIEALQAVARAAEAAGHGQKIVVYQHAAKELGMSLPTLQRKLKEVTMAKPRKKRADAGATNLKKDEALLLSAYLMETQRNNGKRLASFDDAIEVLRANGHIKAERICEKTGEIIPLSVSAIIRALRLFGLHPDQQNRATPKTQLASAHPNHVWQIDPSLCVLYYLRSNKGLQVMAEDEFYKNKPANIAKIENERVWRYVITDHTSGWIFVHYVLGAESGKNLVEAFIAATQKRHANDPVHGVPLMVMVDPGSANISAVAKNLMRALNVKVEVNLPGQPWAKGQVEKANDIVERNFEHRLKFMKNPPTTVDALNDEAGNWMRWFNATKTHTRTQNTRYNVWLRITADQLRIAPSAQVMRELAISKPEERKVSAQLTISFKGKTYRVDSVPHAAVGEKLLVTRNPWRDDESAQIIYTDNEGREIYHVVEAERFGEFGFAESAQMLGEGFSAKRDSYIDTERKAIERIVMGTDTDTAAADKRKRKATPFAGSVDPMKPINETTLPDYIGKRGTHMDIATPSVEFKPLSIAAAAKKLAAHPAKFWNGPEHFAWLQQRYPNGVPEDELGSIAQQLQQVQLAPLRLIK